jgi:hypothetical protein
MKGIIFTFKEIAGFGGHREGGVFNY